MSKTKLILLIVACAFLFMTEGKAQVVLFNNAYDFHELGNFAFDVLVPDDTTFLTLCGSYNYFTSEICPTLSWFRATGNIDSQKCFVKSNYQLYIGEPGSFHADINGGYFYGGSCNYLFDTSYYLSYGMLVRYNQDGDTLFTRTYGDSSKWQAFYGSSQTKDSGYVMIGIQADTIDYIGDFFAVRADKNGNILWEKSYGGSENDGGLRIHIWKNNEFIMAGAKEANYPFYQPYLIIADSEGNSITSKLFYGSYICGGARTIRE